MDVVVSLSQGLSPRGRGNRMRPRSPLSVLRSIPAWAGEPVAGRPQREIAVVYPRVGGGTQFSFYLDDYATGLSPRGRGNQV